MTSPDQVFSDLHRALAPVAGARLFTITRIDRQAGLARRIHTSHPQDYPVTGTKPIRADAWTAQVIDRQQVFVANSTADFADHFPDHALINRLGCQSALNIPVVAQGRVIATVNVLDVAGRFTPQTVAAALDVLQRRMPELIVALAASAP